MGSLKKYIWRSLSSAVRDGEELKEGEKEKEIIMNRRKKRKKRRK